MQIVFSYFLNVCIKQIMDSQDNRQKLNVFISVVLELYRVMVSSLLILFVPQKCNSHVCSMSENMVWQGHTYNTGIVVNFLTMASFLGMYFYEIRRETKLIAYLEVNKQVACDNETVGQLLLRLPSKKKDLILFYDKRYQKVSYFVMLMFVFNTILSGFVVYDYYLDNQTTSTFITNILFMLTKLADVYSTVHTEQNIFYSAYMKEKMQYNDVDPNKLLMDNPVPSCPLDEEMEVIVEVKEEGEEELKA
jgi:hypothetical protein